MYCADHNQALHQLVWQLEEQSLEAWRKAKHRHLDLTDALAVSAKEVNCDLKRKPGGKITLTISVHGPRPYTDEAWWFALQTKDFRGYLVVQETSTLD